MLIQGTLIKGYAGFYYVYADDRVWECSLRGRFRVKKQDFIPGDRVLIQPSVGAKGTIEQVLARDNCLIRPTVANVDQAVLVFAQRTPAPDWNLLDRLLIQIEKEQLKLIIVMTKADLEDHDSLTKADYYRQTGYCLVSVSNKTGEGISQLRAYLKDRISVLAGPSGVGKSSLLNSLEPGKSFKIGEVSEKLGRGKHTTRHVELIPIAEGLVADTPGFSSLHLPSLKREELQGYFPEFQEHRPGCRYSNCLHDKEPDCGVKVAVKKQAVLPSRYENYIRFLQEVIENERRY